MPASWLSSMTTGVEALDVQHRELIDRLNELSEAMDSGNGLDQLPATLAFLTEYAEQHFADEEALMETHRCPVAAVNKHAHAEFTRRFGELKATVDSRGATYLELTQTVRELTDWFIDHIWGCDTRLKGCLK